MKIAITRIDDEYAVWADLDDVPHEPPHGFSFIIATGATEFHARAEAVRALETAIAQLKSANFEVHDLDE